MTSMINSQGLALVEAEYAKLQECIGTLKETIDLNLSEQKEELDINHKTELRKLTIDLDRLKAEKTKLEDAIATNERANLLENERDWYKKEALHLDSLLEESKSECKELKKKLEESKNDRKWMKEQIEKLTKHNWALETKFKEMGIKETTVVGVEKEEEIRPDVEQQKDADFVTETNTKENDST